jgi:enoyl-CoA hydratase
MPSPRTLPVEERDDRVVVTPLVLDAPGGHPVVDDLAQAVLFETSDKRDRMTRFLDRGRNR